MGDPKKFYAKFCLWLFILFFFVIFLKIFGKNFMVFFVYFVVIGIGNMYLTFKVNSSFLSYLKKNYGTWDNMASLLKKTYAINYVPSDLHPFKFWWFIFSEYDLNDENIKNFKLAFKLYPVFVLLLMPSIILTLFFFLLTPSIYDVFGKY